MSLFRRRSSAVSLSTCWFSWSASARRTMSWSTPKNDEATARRYRSRCSCSSPRTKASTPASSGSPGRRPSLSPFVVFVVVSPPPPLPQPATAAAPSVAKKVLRSTRTRSRRVAGVLSTGDVQHDLADDHASRALAAPGDGERGGVPGRECQRTAGAGRVGLQEAPVARQRAARGVEDAQARRGQLEGARAVIAHLAVEHAVGGQRRRRDDPRARGPDDAARAGAVAVVGDEEGRACEHGGRREEGEGPHGASNQSQPGGSGLVRRSQPAHGTSMACLAGSPVLSGLPPGHAGSVGGAPVAAPPHPHVAPPPPPPP